MLDNGSNIPTLLNVEIFQAFQIQKLIGTKWMALGMFSTEWQWLLNLYKHRSTSNHGLPKTMVETDTFETMGYSMGPPMAILV